MGRQIFWDMHGFSGNVFANPTASSSAPYPQESNPWVFNVSEHTSPHVMSEGQAPTQDQRCQSGPSARNSFDPSEGRTTKNYGTQDQRCQSGPSARNSFVPSEGRFTKNYGADQKRLPILDPHFDKFTTSATLACWKIRFKTEYVLAHNFLRKLCCGSKKWRWLNQWMI